MAIPTYKRQAINAQTATEKYGGLASQATAQGNAGVAQSQRGLATQHGQRAGREVYSFADRLNHFTREFEQGLGVFAKQQGVAKANKILVKQKNEIRAIEGNPNLSPEERGLALDNAKEKYRYSLGGIYGEAYNNVMDADYVNNLSIEATTKATEIANASNGDAKAFQEHFKKYTETALDDAPTDATRLIAERAYDQAGLAAFKSLFTKQQAAFNKEAKARSKISAEKIETAYVNAVTSGDTPEAEELRVAYKANKEASAANGWTTRADASYDSYKLNIKGQQASVVENFRTEFENGNGVEALVVVEELNNNGAFNTWESGKTKSIIDAMKTQVKTRGTQKINNTMSALSIGKEPNASELAEAEKFLPYVSEKTQAEFTVAKLGSEMYQVIKDDNLAGQKVAIGTLLAEDGITNEERLGLQAVKKIVDNKLAAAKKDSISLGLLDGAYTIETLVPGKVSLHGVQDRNLASGIAQARYGQEQQFFTGPEVNTFTAYVNNPNTSIDAKLELIQTIDRGTNGDGLPAYTQLSKKGASLFAGVADMVHEGKPETARQMLKGGNLLQEKLVSTDRQVLNETISYKMGNAMMFSGAGDGDKAVKSIEALAAFKAYEAGTKADGIIEDIHVEAAIKEIAGDVAKADNGSNYFAPPGVDADDVEDFFEDMEIAPPINGIPPENTLDILEDATPVHVRDGEYQFVYKNITLTNPDGSVYIIKYLP